MHPPSWVTPRFDMADFFDYSCDTCGAPVCERLQVMNLTLNIEEALYCFPCLTTLQDVPAEDLRETLLDYVGARDCFKKPWRTFKATGCPYPRVETLDSAGETAMAGVCYCRPDTEI